MFCCNKDHIQFQQKANVIYRITCSGCYSKYIGKTDRNIITRLDEHGTKPDQLMYQQLTNCAQFAEYLKFYALPDIDAFNTIVSKELHLHSAVTENTKIVHHNDNCAHLQYLESYYIKAMPPENKYRAKSVKRTSII